MLDLVKELKGVFGMLRDPEHTESVFDIEDGLRSAEATKLSIEYILSCPEMGPVVRERYLRNQPPDLDALGELPVGTLGHAYSRHLTTRGFDPNYYRRVEVVDDESYCIMRTRETHDIWHVVTGFTPTPLGEIGVKAVELAQMHRPMAAVICCGAVFRYMMREPDELGKVLDAISAGYQLGIRANRKLLSMKWEEMWNRELAGIRDELGITSVSPRLSGEDYDEEQL
ncbi:MAG: Coq4 family protein [Planctomycetota bacterium]